MSSPSNSTVVLPAVFASAGQGQTFDSGSSRNAPANPMIPKEPSSGAEVETLAKVRIHLIPSGLARLRFRIWQPSVRALLAAALVAGIVVTAPSVTTRIAAGPSVSAPVTVPVTISVPVTVTSTPPPLTAAGHPAAIPQPVTVVLTTVITTVRTGGPAPELRPAPQLVGPNVGHKAIICFTPATVTLVATGVGSVRLTVVGAANATASGASRARLVVAGLTGYYSVTYAASIGAHLTFHWSTPQGSCS